MNQKVAQMSRRQMNMNRPTEVRMCGCVLCPLCTIYRAVGLVYINLQPEYDLRLRLLMCL